MKKKLKSLLISFCIMILFPSLVFAYYKDKVTSIGNSFIASTLDTILYDSSSNTLELVRDGTVSIDFKLKNTGELQTANTEIITDISNTSLASVIHVTVQIDGGTPTNQGTLASFIMNDFLNQTHNQSNLIKYNFFISANDYDLYPASNISFRIVNKSWQNGLPYNKGFTDIENLEVSLKNSTPLPLLAPIILSDPTDTLINLNNQIIE